MHDRERAHAINQEIALLVRVILDGQETAGDPLNELNGLAKTAGASVFGSLIQRRDKPDVAYYLGKGKVEELGRLVEFHAADVVIFDNDLSPGQTRNLEKELKVKVIDRTELILDIFATHAQTAEARLAVELAQLEYSLPRLKQLWTHLSRIKMGVGMRGPGEKQLEVDRRLVEKRIHELKADLKQVEVRKERLVRSREGRMTVSLVGYTNAGKSTLMNALTGAQVLAEDKLFATLDTRTRRCNLPNWGPILLSDTVGFIRDLPHHLIASFKATLEEANQADLLLHVADASTPAVYQQISSVYGVLQDLGIDEKDMLLVLNKIDAIEHYSDVEALMIRYPNAIPISARTGRGFELLLKKVSETLTRNFRDVIIETDVSNGRLLAFLAANGDVISKQFTEDKVIVHCRLPQKHVGAIDPQKATVRDANPIQKVVTADEILPNAPAESDIEDVA